MPRAAWPGVALPALVLLLLLAPTGRGESAASGCVAGLEARPEADGSILVRWSATEGATGYVVLRAQGSGPLEERARLDASATRWSDPSTEPGATYRYVVAATTADAPTPSLTCEGAHADAAAYARGVLLAVGIAACALLGYVAVRASA